MINEKLIYQNMYTNQKDAWSDQIEMRIVPEVVLAGLPKNKMKILDIGCGNGEDLIFYAKHKHDVTGIDIVKHPALDMIISKHNNIKVVCNSFLDSCYIQDYDLITDNGCFHHFENDDIQIYLAKLNNALKSNGFYAVNTFYSGRSHYKYETNKRFFRYYLPDEIKCIFSSIDLKLIKFHKVKITKSNYYYITYL